ncbi:phosphoribosylamine--glycine ligase [Candidatus Falkowbacteria bacterium]|nr:phosphoribosylamine--glycine ligase [Candidatus Falkowbacteria bacterium]
MGRKVKEKRFKVLVVGGGGREFMLVWKFAQSPQVSKVYCAPGNAGMQQWAELVNIKANDIEGLKQFAIENQINLTVVGPEEPLCMGIVDEFQAAGLTICGPTKNAAQLEGSKAFANGMMTLCKVPTADFRVFEDYKKALAYIEETGVPIVIKADGLAAGKGVYPCQTIEEAKAALKEIMIEKKYGSAGDKVVIEEFLDGEEASFLVFSDGVNVVPLASSQDHKPVFESEEDRDIWIKHGGDPAYKDSKTGPNTGGMGAYSPAPIVTPEVHDQVMNEIILPLIKGMSDEGMPFKGVLYAGLMIKEGKAKVLEFNVRFGDPEAQPLLMRCKTDIFPIMMQIASGGLIEGMELEWDERPAVCVVMASGGYPGEYKKGYEIFGLGEIPDMSILVVHAGTAKKDGKWVTNGGRVLGITTLGKNIEAAIAKIYAIIQMINWKNDYYRFDIGAKAVK